MCNPSEQNRLQEQEQIKRLQKMGVGFSSWTISADQVKQAQESFEHPRPSFAICLPTLGKDCHPTTGERLDLE